MTKNKYHATKTAVDGIVFDSKKEARRYVELTALERAGEISDLRLQVKYELVPEQREPETIGPRGGKRPGKRLEAARYYVADFVYTKSGETVVEDCKGVRTDVYKLKRALMLWKYGIKIHET